MIPASLCPPQAGDKVLDLCAAPGGKSTQLAGYLRGTGLLVANEINPSRATILSQNMERLGISNGVVLNHAPHELAPHFPCFFDKIVVDAPCSGEGMFRKEEQALAMWSQDIPKPWDFGEESPRTLDAFAKTQTKHPRFPRGQTYR